MKIFTDNNPLTTGFKKDEIELLLSIAQTESFYKDEMIFYLDDPADRLYVLLEGKVWIERQLSPPNVPVTRQVLRIKKGQVFGEMGFLEDVDRTASARAASRVKLLSMEYIKLKALFENNNRVGYLFMNNLAAILGMRLRYIHKQLLNSSARVDYLQEIEYYS